MQQLRLLFNAAVGADDGGEWLRPGVDRVAELFVEVGMESTAEDVQSIFESEEWEAERSFDLQALRQLAIQCGDEDGSEEESEELAALIETISQRIVAEVVPVVLPAELEMPTEPEEAFATLGFLRKVEAVKLQSFLDAEFGKYMRDNPGDEKLPLAAKRARWSRDH